MSAPAMSAYVLCCNNAATIGLAVESLRAQTRPPAEILAIDDGSTDESARILAGLPVTVLTHRTCLGRGAGRAAAMQAARHSWVLSCDATAALTADFAERAVPWLEEARVAGVFGRWVQPPARSLADRWRGRHLFKSDSPATAQRGASLATYGSLLRKEAVAAVGGFDPARRAGEDVDLGRRLLAAGYEVVSDPALQVLATRSNSLREVLERYARWNSPAGLSFPAYLRQCWYALKVMVRADLRAGDPAAALVSLLAPHFQYWRS